MATTTILTIHINKGKTPKQCVAAQLNYIMNPTKTNGGALISSHACMPETAVNEFMLYRQEYFENTGREIDVFQIKFVPLHRFLEMKLIYKLF